MCITLGSFLASIHPMKYKGPNSRGMWMLPQFSILRLRMKRKLKEHLFVVFHSNIGTIHLEIFSNFLEKKKKKNRGENPPQQSGLPRATLQPPLVSLHQSSQCIGLLTLRCFGNLNCFLFRCDNITWVGQ